MYRSTLCSYFHIILLNIMQIKFKHILLFIIICFLIYLDFEWFISVDFSTANFSDTYVYEISSNANRFILLHIIISFILFPFLILRTNIDKHIAKLLNKNIFKL